MPQPSSPVARPCARACCCSSARSTTCATGAIMGPPATKTASNPPRFTSAGASRNATTSQPASSGICRCVLTVTHGSRLAMVSRAPGSTSRIASTTPARIALSPSVSVPYQPVNRMRGAAPTATDLRSAGSRRETSPASSDRSALASTASRFASSTPSPSRSGSSARRFRRKRDCTSEAVPGAV